jgi:hypothetical protein
MKTKRKYRVIATLDIVALLFTGSSGFVFAGNPSKAAPVKTTAAKAVPAKAIASKASSAKTAKTVETQGRDIVVTSWLSERTPKDNVSNRKDSSYIQVGVAKNGKNSVGLARFELPAGVASSEVLDAELLLKKKSGPNPSVKVGIATKDWAFSSVTWNEMEGKTKYEKQAPRLSADGGRWYAADVTKIVKSWLSGKTNNLGFALTGTMKGKVTKFVSAYAKNEKDYPTLKITYKSKKLTKRYGKFGYTKQDASKGNCFSYAMRDTDEIFLDDILTPAQKREFQNISNKSAKAGLDYFKKRIFNYIDRHKPELGIKSWRTLSSYSKKYDPQKEYLAVMKIGFLDKGYGSGPKGSYIVDKDFDYHWHVRLDDGRWAEKITGLKSRVAPGSNLSYDNAKYPWDSSYKWGYERSDEFYDSSPVYIAVTKNTDKFTAHKH